MPPKKKKIKRVNMQVRQSGSRFGLLSVNSRDNDFRRDLLDQGFKEHENVVIVSEADLEELLQEHIDYKLYYDAYYK